MTLKKRMKHFYHSFQYLLSFSKSVEPLSRNSYPNMIQNRRVKAELTWAVWCKYLAQGYYAMFAVHWLGLDPKRFSPADHEPRMLHTEPPCHRSWLSKCLVVLLSIWYLDELPGDDEWRPDQRRDDPRDDDHGDRTRRCPTDSVGQRSSDAHVPVETDQQQIGDRGIRHRVVQR